MEKQNCDNYLDLFINLQVLQVLGWKPWEGWPTKHEAGREACLLAQYSQCFGDACMSYLVLACAGISLHVSRILCYISQFFYLRLVYFTINRIHLSANIYLLQAYLAYGANHRVNTTSISKVESDCVVLFFTCHYHLVCSHITTIFQATYNVGGQCINAHLIQSHILGIQSHLSAPVCMHCHW